MVSLTGNTNELDTGLAGQKRPKIVFATGGSGGHIFPALSIAAELRRRGYVCSFIGHVRDFAGLIEREHFKLTKLKASPWNAKGFKQRTLALGDFFAGFSQAVKQFHKQKPVAVVGMGGYSSIAPILAAKILGIPVVIHEQNARPGKANKLLAKFAGLVLLAFSPARQHFKGVKAHRLRIVGNPLRQGVHDALSVERESSDTFSLLIVGGSQGARIFSDVVPAAITSLSADDQKRLFVTQQVRPEDEERVKKVYQEAGVAHNVATFFDDLPEKMRQANLLIGRAGAGTVAECALLRRGAIFVPLAIVDQSDNAKVLADAGAAEIIEQDKFTPETLAKSLQDYLHAPARLTAMEENASLLARPLADKEAADEIERLLSGEYHGPIETFQTEQDS